jgi:hypothetical protein
VNACSQRITKNDPNTPGTQLAFQEITDLSPMYAATYNVSLDLKYGKLNTRKLGFYKFWKKQTLHHWAANSRRPLSLETWRTFSERNRLRSPPKIAASSNTLDSIMSVWSATIEPLSSDLVRLPRAASGAVQPSPCWKRCDRVTCAAWGGPSQHCRRNVRRLYNSHQVALCICS